jgi:transcriptional regulator GlxA family with amidase domain
VGPLPKIQIMLFDGFDDLDAVAPLEVLTEAGFPVRVLGAPDAQDHVISAHGLRIAVEGHDRRRPELIVLPGGGWIDESPAGVRAQCQGPLPALLSEWHSAGTVVTSVCTGAMLLAAAGLLNGRPAVTNHGALADLARAGADVRSTARVVDDGSIVTCGGPSAGLDFGLRLVARFAGPEAAAEAAARLEYVPVGPVEVTSPGGDPAPD